jgi:hypothetical protein
MGIEWHASNCAWVTVRRVGDHVAAAANARRADSTREEVVRVANPRVGTSKTIESPRAECVAAGCAWVYPNNEVTARESGSHREVNAEARGHVHHRPSHEVRVTVAHVTTFAVVKSTDAESPHR